MTLVIVQGQIDLDSVDGCFSSGECALSLSVNVWPAADAQQCLELCQEDEMCNYFTFKESLRSCEGFANCEFFSTNSCTDCFSAGIHCRGKSKGAIIYIHFKILESFTWLLVI